MSTNSTIGQFGPTAAGQRSCGRTLESKSAPARPLHRAAYHSRPEGRSLFTATECAMLVLTRKLQQQIMIGEQITVTILRVKGNTVRVGIQAPRDVRVVRGELPKEPTGQQAVVEAVVSIEQD